MSTATPIQHPSPTSSDDSGPSTSRANSAPGWDWRDSMTRDELQELLRVDDRRAWLTLATNWGLIFASFALVAWAPNPFTILLALFVIGARQLGFAVVMHEAAHRTFFSNRALNDWAGNWLAAYPVWTDLVPYRHYHLKHHSKTGTAEDPDLGLVLPFPITPASMRRKIWRDLSGQTGWKQATAVAKRDLGLGDKASMRNQAPFNPASDQPRTGWRVIAPVVITNGILLGILALFGAPELYLLWVVAWFTTNRLVGALSPRAESRQLPSRTPSLDDGAAPQPAAASRHAARPRCARPRQRRAWILGGVPQRGLEAGLVIRSVTQDAVLGGDRGGNEGLSIGIRYPDLPPIRC